MTNLVVCKLRCYNDNIGADRDLFFFWFRQVGLETRLAMETYTPLSSLPIGTVIEGHKLVLKSMGAYDAGILTAVLRLNKATTNASILLPERLAKKFEGQVPAVFVYCGAVKSSTTDKLWYDLQLMLEGQASGIGSIRDHANHLRKMSVKDLLAKAKTYSLKSFAPGTVLTCWGLETRIMSDGETIPVASFDTYVDDGKGMREQKQGKLFLPRLYLDELMGMDCCIVVYKGLKTSKTGREYHNLSITPLPKFIEPNMSNDELATSLFGLVLPSDDELLSTI